MKDKKRSLFLTGVTGTLGQEMVRELLETSNVHLTLLVRRKKRLTHWDRVRKILEPGGLTHLLGTRVQVLEGDVTEPDLGLCAEDIRRLKESIDEFFHVAALTALNGSREDCFRINTQGTGEVLKMVRMFHREGALKRFFYFSTAYAAGSLQRYKSHEDGLPEEPVFANHYEASKYAAETKVRKAMAEGLPATIFRPSIVVGNSKTGEVSQFNVIYPFMRLFAHGLLKKLPTHPGNSFNIVPIDFVCSAALAIARQKNSVGKCFHLVTLQPPSIGELLKVKDEEYPNMPPIEVIPPEQFRKDDLTGDEQLVYEMLSPYLGYLNGELTFDARNTREALKGTGLEFPKTDFEFLKILTRYAVDSGYLVVH